VVVRKDRKIAGKSDRELLFWVGFGLNGGEVAIMILKPWQKDILIIAALQSAKAENIFRVLQGFFGIHESKISANTRESYWHSQNFSSSLHRFALPGNRTRSSFNIAAPMQVCQAISLPAWMIAFSRSRWKRLFR
jgi:hypothetical protein